MHRSVEDLGGGELCLQDGDIVVSRKYPSSGLGRPAIRLARSRGRNTMPQLQPHDDRPNRPNIAMVETESESQRNISARGDVLVLGRLGVTFATGCVARYCRSWSSAW